MGHAIPCNDANAETVARDWAGKAVRTAAVPAQQASIGGVPHAARTAAGAPWAGEGKWERKALTMLGPDMTFAVHLGQAAQARLPRAQLRPTSISTFILDSRFGTAAVRTGEAGRQNRRP